VPVERVTPSKRQRPSCEPESGGREEDENDRQGNEARWEAAHGAKGEAHSGHERGSSPSHELEDFMKGAGVSIRFARKSTGGHRKVNHLDGKNVSVKFVGPKAKGR